MLKICPNCGMEFDAKGPNAKFCNPKCQREFKIKEKQIVIEKICKNCGKTFSTTDKRKEYCSEECLKNNKKKHIQTKICPNCGKEFKPNSNRTIFCCKDCKEIYESKQKFKDVDDAIICKECGMMGHNLLKHIGSKHGSIEEYCKKYNCSRNDLISEKTHNNLSERQKLLLKQGIVKGFTSENNPSKGEDCKNGRNSPYSMNFRGYDGLSDEEKKQKINELLNHKIESTNNNFNNPKTIEYYIKRGFNLCEAKQELHKSQQTFTLEKCIEKFGEEDGRKKWLERQEKWLNTLNNKSDEEKERINLLKLNGILNQGSYSKISQELFWGLFNIVKNDFQSVYFASLNHKTQLYDESGRNNEYWVKRENNKFYLLDFYVKDINKVIEFDGDYWHSEARGNRQRDKKREDELRQMGYDIFRVKERDYRKNPDKVIQECLNFLKSQ